MSLRKQVLSGLVWTFGQQFGNQLVGFIVSLTLARILLPEEFGLIAMITFFIAIGQVLVDSGLTDSLIRTKEPDNTDYSTVFYFNLVLSSLMYVVVYFSAPYIAEFYNQDILTGIARLYALTFIINAFSTVQLTRLTKLMRFKSQALISIPATISGGVMGIILAYYGFGVWSLVWSQITASLVSSIQVWLYSKWIPDFTFSKGKFKKHFKFGYQLGLSGLLNKIFNNIYILIIGKFFSPAQLGFYTRAETMKQLPVRNLSSALNKVSFPLFAEIDNDQVRLKRVYKQFMQTAVFIISPILIIFAVLAEPLFRFLFTEKWLPAVPYFQVIFFTGILAPIHSYNLNILKIKGRSDLFLKISVLKKVFILMTIVLALQYGIYGLLFGQVILSILFFFINGYYTNLFLGYRMKDQIKDISPILFISSLVGVIVFLIDSILLSYFDFIRLVAGGISGILILVVLSHIFKLDSYRLLIKILLKK
ncbi:lipopolysaccharide biosynthesis protein [Salegentibacter sp. F14]